MPEVPSAPASAGASASSTVLSSSHTGSLKIPSFGADDYNEWVLPRLVAARMVAYEANMGKVKQPCWRKTLLALFESIEQDALYPEDHILHWNEVPKKKKKNVSFFQDVPYKHSERTGEVFEGPVTSQLTFEKDRGEDKMVFVNPECSA
jgi:hypothetical protein